MFGGGPDTVGENGAPGDETTQADRTLDQHHYAGVKSLGREVHPSANRNGHGEVTALPVHGLPVVDGDLNHDGDRYRDDHRHGRQLHEAGQRRHVGQQPPQAEEPEQNEAAGPCHRGIAPHLGTSLLDEERAKHQRYSFRNRASRLVEWV